MKTNILFLISITLLISLLLIAGCATTSLIEEPTNHESTLLLGRIKLTGENFPISWNMNREITSGLAVYLVDISTKEVITIRSFGKDGLFHLIDPDAGQYAIKGFELLKKSTGMRISLSYPRGPIQPIYISIKKNCVNNLGDIRWNEVYATQVSKEVKTNRTEVIFSVIGMHTFKHNHDEVENWFRETYPESVWNQKEWVDVTISSD
ncbi:MAG: hypothetical protein JSV25_04940 [Spirochaetota bacterium]|nr:MAG: hypothetical protein JSV25_04940 [Spirochaetota bacterium]